MQRSRSQESGTTSYSRNSKSGTGSRASQLTREPRFHPRDCPHDDTTKSGSNLYVIKERCRQCNTVLIDRKRTKEEIDEMLDKKNDEKKKTGTTTTMATSSSFEDTEADFRAFLQWRQERSQSSESNRRSR